MVMQRFRRMKRRKNTGSFFFFFFVSAKEAEEENLIRLESIDGFGEVLNHVVRESVEIW